MIVQKIREYLAADAKIRMITGVAPRRLGQRETDLAESFQALLFALCSFLFGHHRLRLTYAKRLNRRADQSSSIATIRTDSKPASRMTCHPESRLNSQT